MVSRPISQVYLKFMKWVQISLQFHRDQKNVNKNRCQTLANDPGLSTPEKTRIFYFSINSVVLKSRFFSSFFLRYTDQNDRLQKLSCQASTNFGGLLHDNTFKYLTT